MGERLHQLRPEDARTVDAFHSVLSGIVTLKDIPPDDGGTLAVVPDAPKSPPSPHRLDHARGVSDKARDFLGSSLQFVG